MPWTTFSKFVYSFQVIKKVSRGIRESGQVTDCYALLRMRALQKKARRRSDLRRTMHRQLDLASLLAAVKMLEFQEHPQTLHKKLAAAQPPLLVQQPLPAQVALIHLTCRTLLQRRSQRFCYWPAAAHFPVA